MGRLRPGLVAVILLAGCATLGDRADHAGWEPTRWERLRLAAQEARDRGDTAEAERHCVRALEYVGVSTVKNLAAYAALLKSLQRPEADAAQARADTLRRARSGRAPGSTYLGWVPASELAWYAALLRELGRDAEADAMLVLADAEEWAQQWHYARLLEQAGGVIRGGNVEWPCTAPALLDTPQTELRCPLPRKGDQQRRPERKNTPRSAPPGPPIEQKSGGNQ